jgi:DNA-directed RNA polymerase subunit RPC12/RpoP
MNAGLKVQCPNCRRVLFETTERYDPNVAPHGGMVRSLVHFHIDWLTTSTTKASEMTCPECLAQLVLNGMLRVLVPARRCGEFFDTTSGEPAVTPSVGDPEDPRPSGEIVSGTAGAAFSCSVCGQPFETRYSLMGNKKKHKGESAHA